MATTQDYINQLKIDKQNLVNMLNNMGVEATNTETFTSLTPKVGKIVTDPILQDKSIEITENGTQTISADAGYNGLNEVAITVEVEGKEDLTEELNTYNNELSEQEEQLTTVIQKLKNKAGVKTPEKGLIINEWDINGYPTSVTLYNMQLLNTGLFRISSSSASILSYISDIEIIGKLIDTLPEYGFYGLAQLKTIKGIKNIVMIRDNAFAYCYQLEMAELPDGLTSIGQSAFSNCSKITIKTIPNGVTTLNGSTFSKCTSITQLSIPKVATITSITANASCFANCTNLKAVWIGSAITNSGLNNYAFSTCANLTKMFIDLPRATVETYSSYSTYSSKIVCNDDAGFMTKEQFDAIDWATYSV